MEQTEQHPKRGLSEGGGNTKSERKEGRDEDGQPWWLLPNWERSKHLPLRQNEYCLVGEGEGRSLRVFENWKMRPRPAAETRTGAVPGLSIPILLGVSPVRKSERMGGKRRVEHRLTQSIRTLRARVRWVRQQKGNGQDLVPRSNHVDFKIQAFDFSFHITSDQV